jgi:hypothetical protein
LLLKRLNENQLERVGKELNEKRPAELVLLAFFMKSLLSTIEQRMKNSEIK